MICNRMGRNNMDSRGVKMSTGYGEEEEKEIQPDLSCS